MDKLTRLRHEIDKIDLQILKDLKRRFSITKRVQEWKKRRGLALFQKSRENDILRRLQKNCRKFGLSQKMIRHIYENLFAESRGRKS